MKKDKVIRVYELSEAVHNEDLGYNNGDLEYIDLNQAPLVLQEYLQVNENKVPTGRTLPINDLINIINKEIAKGKMTGTVSIDKTDSSIYKFSLEGNGNVKEDKFSNIETNEITVKIPGDIAKRYMFHQQIDLLEKTLLSAAKLANQMNYYERSAYKLQRQYKFKKAAGIVGITAATIAVIGGLVAASPKLISALQEKQAMQRQKEVEMLKQQGPSISELQQQDDYDQLDTWDTYLKQQVEEQQEQRKLP